MQEIWLHHFTSELCFSCFQVNFFVNISQGIIINSIQMAEFTIDDFLLNVAKCEG